MRNSEIARHPVIAYKNMALTMSEIQLGVEKFSSKIYDQPLGLARHQPHPNVKHTNCIANVLSVIEIYDGSIRYGWYFLYRTSLEFGYYIIAIHHAVWHNPKDFALIDVTPFHPEEIHVPIAPNGDLLFLVDDSAKPIDLGKVIITLPSRFYPLRPDLELERYLSKLQQEEYSYYKLNYGVIK